MKIQPSFGVLPYLINLDRGDYEGNIYFVSDPHYGHKNLVEGQSRWPPNSGQRPFQTVEEMNEELVESINSTVPENSLLFMLGDVAYPDPSNIAKFRALLKCKKVVLISGNHDKYIRARQQQYIGNAANQFQAFHDIAYMTVTYDGVDQFVVLCHYPFLVWEGHDKGSWHLHGHCHGSLNLPDYYTRKVMDVAWENLGASVISFTDVHRIMSSPDRKIVLLDHHGTPGHDQGR